MSADSLFRFQKLDVWQRAVEVGIHLGDLADLLDEKRKYRYAEQLRSAAVSISNNIAEGSGSNSSKDFHNFLNIAHRSAFECASMLLMFNRQELIPSESIPAALDELAQVCRMLTGLSRTL